MRTGGDGEIILEKAGEVSSTNFPEGARTFPGGPYAAELRRMLVGELFFN